MTSWGLVTLKHVGDSLIGVVLSKGKILKRMEITATIKNRSFAYIGREKEDTTKICVLHNVFWCSVMNVTLSLGMGLNPVIGGPETRKHRHQSFLSVRVKKETPVWHSPNVGC